MNVKGKQRTGLNWIFRTKVMRISNRIPLNGKDLEVFKLTDFLDNEFDYRIYNLLRDSFRLKDESELDYNDSGELIYNDNRLIDLLFVFKRLYALLELAYSDNRDFDDVEYSINVFMTMLWDLEKGNFKIKDHGLFEVVVCKAFSMLYQHYEISNFLFTDLVEKWNKYDEWVEIVGDRDEDIIEFKLFKPLDYYKSVEAKDTKDEDIENKLTDGQGKGNTTIKPTIDAKIVSTLCERLQGYFESDRHSELKTVLETGNSPGNKLIFKGNANKLTDAFKQLYDSNLIAGCQKQDLVKWIADSFQCINKGIVKDLNIATTERSISGNDYNCKNPIIRVVNGEIIRA